MMILIKKSESESESDHSRDFFLAPALTLPLFPDFDNMSAPIADDYRYSIQLTKNPFSSI
jgi:hypothetical protein